tara:strand:- start:10523 stop:12829 length:2307 start_codon:yes stop_codon:yes gene_type:complete
MGFEAWLDRVARPATENELTSNEAKGFVSYVANHAESVCQLIEIHCGEKCDLVIVDIQTGRPQRCEYPINRVERIAVSFPFSDGMHLVHVLREDFPETFHQHAMPEDWPPSICIDNRSWPVARLNWTPAELIHRILIWFDRTFRGELHDEQQPLEAFLLETGLSFIIPRELLEDDSIKDLVGVHEGRRKMLRVQRCSHSHTENNDAEPIAVVALKNPAERMSRMTKIPANLGSLAELLQSRGVDLMEHLREHILEWFGRGDSESWRKSARLVVIIEMPIVSPSGTAQGADLRAFMVESRVGEVAVSMGLAYEATSKDEGSQSGFELAIPPVDRGLEGVREIAIQSAAIHYEFDRPLATKLSGRSEIDARTVVQVGAGSIGSHVATVLAKEGRFEWMFIDEDQLLPHNVARHWASNVAVTTSKAEYLARMISLTLHAEEPIAGFIHADVTSQEEGRDEIEAAFDEADLIFDAAASPMAGRYVSDHPSSARRASFFFNPRGDSVVLLVEPADRALTLRDIESQYIGHIVREVELEEHLLPPTGQYAYTGACRAITNLTPENQVMALSGLVAGWLGRAIDRDAGLIRIGSLQDEGGVSVFEPEMPPMVRFQANDWTITFDDGLVHRIREMRQAHLPAETGGVVIGVVDIPQKHIQLIEAACPPGDSRGTPSGFVRGVEGVSEYLKDVEKRTQGNARYVGEWHSHPEGASTRPSAIDLRQIDWLASICEIESLPALMLIVGDDDIRVVFADVEAAPVAEGEAVTAGGEVACG